MAQHTQVLTPDPVHNPAIERSLRKLDEFRSLEDDWDGEGAIAPRTDTVEAAQRFLAEVAAKSEGLEWIEPVIGLNDDGQIHISWRNVDHGVAFVIEGASSKRLSCVIRRAGTPPCKEVVPMWQAVKHVRWALNTD